MDSFGRNDFTPFGSSSPPVSSPQVSSPQLSSFWEVQTQASRDALVVDAGRHRQVPQAGRVSSPGMGSFGFGTVDATLHSLQQEHAFAAQASADPMQSPVYGKMQYGRAAPSHQGRGLSTSTSLGDIHLSQGTSYSGLSLDVSLNSALNPHKSIAELSIRRRDAIKAAFRRIDPRGQGWVTVHDLIVACQQLSNLEPGEQQRVVASITNAGGGRPSDWGTHIPYAAFAGYYQLLGNSIERDRDFEDLMRHHWGFAEVSDILEDMKNKFAMVGLAYAFRRSLEHGCSELSAQAFQDAIGQVGMHYSTSDVGRLCNSFSTTGVHGDMGRKSLEVLRLTQHLTSAPRPSSPLPALYGSAHFSEVNSHSQSEAGEANHTGTGYMSTSQGSGFMGYSHGQGQVASPSRHAMHGGIFNHDGQLPPIVPAPPEDHDESDTELHSYHHPPEAPAEGDDTDGPVAPPEDDKHGKRELEQCPEAPPEKDDEGDMAPEETDEDNLAADPPEAPLGDHYSPPHHSYEQQVRSPTNTVASVNHYRDLAPVNHYSAVPAMPSAPAGLGRKRAVTVGINYIGLQCQLSGCINDSDTFITLLTQDFGYNVADIRQLRDDHPQRTPTRKNITAALHWLVKGAREGDHLFFHYSGHGSQQTDRDGDEMDGKDDTLVPCDYQQAGMLSDDELRRMLVQNLPKGARLTCILDCCHSGTALDLPYKVKSSGSGLIDIKKKAPHTMPKEAEGDAVMLSGCMDTQTSADIGAGSAGNTKSAGAMTTAFRTVISRNKNASYATLLHDMRSFLKSQRFEQVPQLSSEHFLNLSDCFMPEADAPHVEPEKSMRPPVRKALTIGINYLTLWPGKGRLSGCINDSETMVGILKDTFHFDESQICRLRDDRANMMPTKANILASLRWLTHGAQNGDELFLHYSGHGGQQEDTNGDEASGKDDTLIPCDFQTAGQIVDDELHSHLVAPLPKGCRMWVMLDCCHSGTALDLPYKVALSTDGKSVQVEHTPAATQKRPAKRQEAEVIMISGCKDTQTSADVSAGAMGTTKAAGAMTTAFRHCVNADISCHDLLFSMRDFLQRNKYVQVPQMSSEQFVQLDSSFVGYSTKSRTKMPTPSGTAAAAVASAKLPGGVPVPQSTSSFSAHMHHGVSPHAAVPPQQMPVSPFHNQTTNEEPDKYAMHSRIGQLEEQIASLRHQQSSSPVPAHPGLSQQSSSSVPAHPGLSPHQGHPGHEYMRPSDGPPFPGSPHYSQPGGAPPVHYYGMPASPHVTQASAHPHGHSMSPSPHAHHYSHSMSPTPHPHDHYGHSHHMSHSPHPHGHYGASQGMHHYGHSPPPGYM